MAVPTRGVAFWESGRGCTTHHIVVDDGSLDTYQIVAPSTWSTSPTDDNGVHGPMETAVANTPLLESFADPDDLTAVDVLRAVRSFDPCMVCAGH